VHVDVGADQRPVRGARPAAGAPRPGPVLYGRRADHDGHRRRMRRLGPGNGLAQSLARAPRPVPESARAHALQAPPARPGANDQSDPPSRRRRARRRPGHTVRHRLPAHPGRAVLLRAPKATTDWKVAGASFGHCCSKKQAICGFKLHLLTTQAGLIRDFELAPANLTDREVGAELLAAQMQPHLLVLAAKGYISRPLAHGAASQPEASALGGLLPSARASAPSDRGGQQPIGPAVRCRDQPCPYLRRVWQRASTPN
jgi:hypothetical protein